MHEDSYQVLGQDYLEHYGVKGMRWGVRRYQNDDGSLTEAGKKKLSKYKEKETARARKNMKRDINRTLSYGRWNKNKGMVNAQRKYMALEYKKRFEDEMKVIGKMKFKDMQKEKSALGKAILKSTLITIGTHSGAALIGSPVAVTAVPRSAAEIKRAMRTPNAKTDYEIAKGAGKVGYEYRQAEKEKELKKYLK